MLYLKAGAPPNRCDLIEAALKKVGPEGTYEDFNQAVGRIPQGSIYAGTELPRRDG
jgi:hypothetical protein